MGSSGGGGSSSGTIDYPDYMESQHEDWLDELDALITTLTTGASPFAGSIAYDPDTPIAAMLAAATGYDALIGALDMSTDVGTAISTAITQMASIDDSPTWEDISPAAESEISDSVDAFQDVQDDIVENETLPRFKAGMRDINAVQTTAFTLGQSYIEASVLRDVAKYQGDLRMAAFLKKDELEAAHTLAKNNFNLTLELDQRKNTVVIADLALKHLLAIHEFERSVTHYIIESNRIKIVAKKEEFDANFLIDEKDAKWDLEAYQYGANMLGAIAGGTVPNTAKQSAFASALGGALSGAAVGAQVSGGNPMVAGAGAILGAASSLL
jgi:hypothetical protein